MAVETYMNNLPQIVISTFKEDMDSEDFEERIEGLERRLLT